MATLHDSLISISPSTLNLRINVKGIRDIDNITQNSPQLPDSICIQASSNWTGKELISAISEATHTTPAMVKVKIRSVCNTK